MKNHFSTNRFTAFLLVVLLFLSLSMQAVTTTYYFYVQFSNKNDTPYSLSNPSQYLSQRAIERRTAFAISYDSTDLPVNPSYLQQIESIGIPVHNKSKWMNGATVLLEDSSKMSLVRALPFVKWVQYTGKNELPPSGSPRKIKSEVTFEYGTANTQINQISGKFLHDNGFRGKNIHVGVIDAGFMNVNTNPAFDSLRLQGRLLGTKDIINPNSNIYAEDAHGANVLSIMTGNLPNQYLGTAPDASYWLIRTEYAPTEYKVETDFWSSGIEFADSVGVDVVNSSLGYYTFDDTSMSFSYADMNGTVSRASRAANLASKKGMILVISAGNEGSKSWHYIGSPADAQGIVTAGGVQADGLPSVFSSFGPSSDGRVKPEICAQGTSTSVINTNGIRVYGNGTSYSSPVLAGMMASYLQAAKKTFPPYNVATLIQNVINSASLFNNPTAQMGYGVPNFEYAARNLPFFTGFTEIEANKNFNLAYDFNNMTIQIWMPNRMESIGKTIQLYAMNGKMMLQRPMSETMNSINVAKFPVGIYAVCIFGNGISETRKILIQK
ncbi:MAG: S8 family serine peptidase [Paludibacter sp.]|nr:S8 family serine peptidase [Paludibacter sp.]